MRTHRDGFDDYSEEWTLNKAGQKRKVEQCIEYSCPEFGDFRHFFKTLKPFLLHDELNDSTSPDQYDNFILEQFLLNQNLKNR